MDKVEDEWGFEELKIVRELAMAAIDTEDRVVEVLHWVLLKTSRLRTVCVYWFVRPSILIDTTGFEDIDNKVCTDIFRLLKRNSNRNHPNCNRYLRRNRKDYSKAGFLVKLLIVFT